MPADTSRRAAAGWRRPLSLSSSGDPTTARARALTALAGIAYWQIDFDAALSSYEEALHIHRVVGDRAAIAGALLNVGQTRAVKRDLEAGVALIEESLALAHELQDRRGEAWARWGLGAARLLAGDLDASRDHFEQSVRIFQDVADDTWGWGNALGGLAGLAAMRGDAIEARKLILQGIALWGEQASAVGVAGTLRSLALVANQTGQPERAARLAGAEAAWRGKVGLRFRETFSPDDPGQAAARQLSDDAFQRAWVQGQAMGLEEALAYASEDA